MRDQSVKPNPRKRRIVCLSAGFLSVIPVQIMLLLVRIYQWLLSPLKQLVFGPTCGCRFQPTCSCYAHSAFLQFGFCKGLWLASSRILRCHPWHPGGYDPLPSAERSGRGNCAPDIKLKF